MELTNAPQARTSLIQQKPEPLNINIVSVISAPDLHNFIRLPLDTLGTTGIALSSLVRSTPVTGTLYRAVTADGSPIRLCYACKNGIGLSSGYLSNGAVASAHFQEVMAASVPAVVNPTALFMALALHQIEKKLDTISQTQREILKFLEEEKKATLRGNLCFLMELLESYRFHWENEMFCSNMHKKVQDIHQSAIQDVLFYRQMIEQKLGSRKPFETDQIVSSRLKMVVSSLECYKQALYLVGFTSFLETLLLKKFEASYLRSIEDRLSSESTQYREVYTACYDKLVADSGRSVQNAALNHLGRISSAVGKAIEKIPIISNSQIDENFIRTGRMFQGKAAVRSATKIVGLTVSRDAGITPFIESIQAIDQTYNAPTELFADRDYLYARPLT